MTTLIKNVVIARVGKIIDGREITLSMLEHCVETFNTNYYQPNIGELIGDPMETVDIKNQGKIERLTLKDDTLFADVEMYMPIADVKKLCQFPAIAYRNYEGIKVAALMYVILAEIPNRKDCIALKDCEMTEIKKMKSTIENVQVAIKGITKYNNTCISEKLLAVVAGNYAKNNNIITLHLQSLYEDENFDSIVGEIKNLYYTEADGRPQLRGDITFDTELLDLQSLLHSLANGCVYLSPYFMNIASSNHCFACLSSVTISKAEAATFLGIEPLDISCLNGLINALYKEPATETPAKPQGDTPYIYAPGMSREDIEKWISEVQFNLTSVRKDEAELKEMEANTQLVKLLFKDREKFLNKTIRV